MIDVLEPDLVIVMVGVNDFWSVPLPIGEVDGEERVVFELKTSVFVSTRRTSS